MEKEGRRVSCPCWGPTGTWGTLGMLSTKYGRQVSGEKGNVWAQVAVAETREGSRGLAGS